MSEDISKALKDATELLNGNNETLIQNTTRMISSLERNGVNEKAILDDIIYQSGTRIHDNSKKALDESLSAPGGMVDYATKTWTSITGNDSSGSVNGWINGFKASSHTDAEKTINSIDAIIDGANDKSVTSKIEVLKQYQDAHFAELEKQAQNTGKAVGSNNEGDSIKSKVAEISNKISNLVTSAKLD